jgi:hypothetical protein
MRITSNSSALAQEGVTARAATWRWRGQLMLLAVLASQYLLMQLWTGAQYWDSPRNLHWGVYVAEQPGFLLNQPDRYNWVNGFVPDPATLAPAGLAGEQRGALHPWWGPLYLLLFGAVWRLTGSYTVLQLVVPLAAGVLVLMTYRFGERHLGHGVGLLGAVLLALFPVFREHAALSFVEPLSALLLFGALAAFAQGRTWWAAGLGALAMYGKIDLIGLYLGTSGLLWLALRRSPEQLSARHAIIALGVPLACLLPWLVLVYGVFARPATVSGGPSLGLFRSLAPQMVSQLFTLPLALAGVLLVGLFAAAAVGVRHGLAAGRRRIVLLLGIWLGLGGLVLAFYSSMPGASNNPRVFIPALPALCLLAASGVVHLGGRVRVYGTALVVALFLVLAAQSVVFQVLQARVAGGATEAWETLRRAPAGVVLTEHYWHAALYARQPAAWFEHDPAFERNIMHDEGNFRRYLAANPIRYVVLPRSDDGLGALRADRLYQVYERLPIGRDLGWREGPLAAPAVRAYLERSFPRWEAGEYVIFVVRLLERKAEG